MSKQITLSAIKADIGGLVGHSSIHPALLERGQEEMAAAKKKGLLIDFHVTHCGDDLELIMTHTHGVDSEKCHTLAWDTFSACTQVAKELHLYGAGQDLLSDAFAGTIRGMGPGLAEMTFVERQAETIIVLMADKTAAGAWNLPLYKMFADPFNSAGLVISTAMHDGFRFEVLDMKANRKIFLDAPQEIYDLLMFIGASGRYVVRSIWSKKGDIAAASSTQKLAHIAGKYVGKDDPVCIVRSQAEFPAVGEILEPFTNPFIVAGWTRGSHHGPLIPVALEDATPSRFDGPPRAVALGFQLADGKLVGPRDMFADIAFDEARHQANLIADYLRKHGPFEPHRLPLEEMEYTTMPQIMERLAGRWQAAEEEKEPAMAGR